ncbi:MAG: asparaginase domain-containing protein [Rubricoccaceae bacterium]|nr:asparaginase domain-containing protein [Rubricoccaceae bacterium]
MHIQVFTTGGTIDKLYFDAKSEFAVGEPQIAEIFSTAGVSFTYDVEVLMRKDSLDLTDDDRALVAERVAGAEADRVLLTHGTDTMVETAKAVAAGLGPEPTKTVVLVGSLTPARFKATDAEFNVGFAAAAVQALAPGVYVAMNGRVFRPDAVQKNRALNRFEPAAPASP